MGVGKRTRQQRRKHVALLLVEGETEEEFYTRLSSEHFALKPKRVKNLRGNFNINAKIADAAVAFAHANPADTFDVYVCVDQERIGTPPFNQQQVEHELARLENFRKIVPVVAVLMIESLFFIDIEGLYRLLRARKSRRNPNKYRRFRSLRHEDLTALFRAFGKMYYKGHRCEGLVRALDLAKLITKANELRSLYENATGTSWHDARPASSRPRSRRRRR